MFKMSIIIAALVYAFIVALVYGVDSACELFCARKPRWAKKLHAMLWD